MLMVVSSSVWPSSRWKVSWRVRLTSNRWSHGAAMAVPVVVMRRVASVVCLDGTTASSWPEVSSDIQSLMVVAAA